MILLIFFKFTKKKATSKTLKVKESVHSKGLRVSRTKPEYLYDNKRGWIQNEFGEPTFIGSTEKWGTRMRNEL